MAQTTVIGPRHSHIRVLEDDGTINVSQSKVNAWRRCRQQYHYKYVQQLVAKRVKRPFTFGRIVHSMLESFAEGDDPFEVLDNLELNQGDYFRREIEMYGEILDDTRMIMQEYFSYWGEKSLIYIRKNKRSSEHEFRIELEKGLWFTGRIDGVGKAKRMKWLVEHKSFKRMPSENDRWRSVQAAVYFRALQIIGWPEIDGVLWDYIGSKPPTMPERLKNGEMSKRRIVTLPSKVRAYIAENNLNPLDYTEFLTQAEEDRSNYFIRLFNPVKKPVVNSVWQDFIETAREIAVLHGRAKVKNIGQHCSWCDYEPLCRAEMQGSDVDFILQHDYTIETEDEDGDDEND